MGGSSKAELWRAFALGLALAGVACSSAALTPRGDDDAEGGLGGKVLSVSVPGAGSGEALVDLATPAVLAPADARPALGWDLGFRGFDVFTNGGVSSSGAGAAFGLLTLPSFLSDTTPAVPFLTPDQPGGAFRGWSAYDPENHVLVSRFHVYGLRDGERWFKVQVLSYYGGRSGETSARYWLRYAELDPSDGADLGGVGATRELTELDASAEGDAKKPDAPSTCVDLASGAVLSLTPAEAQRSLAWQLCFRRDGISVNGGAGGPRGVTAVDLDAARAASELVSELRTLTPDSELARFEAIGPPELVAAAADFRADGLVTAFTGRWLVKGSTPPSPESGVWLVVGADGVSNYLVVFEGFEHANESGPGTIRMRVKAVQ